MTRIFHGVLSTIVTKMKFTHSTDKVKVIEYLFDIPNPKNETKVQPYIYEKIIDKVLGQMYLINNKALIARCSCQIMFFKLQIDLFTKEERWMCYRILDHRGMIYFIKGNT